MPSKYPAPLGATMHAQLSVPLRELLLSLLQIRSENELHHGEPELALQAGLEKAVRRTEQLLDDVERLSAHAAPSHPDAVFGGPGLGVWPPRLANGAPPIGPRGPRGTLTAREQEVLGLINSGSSNKEGAHQLRISIRTFEAHRAQIMRKLGARNAADLVRMTFNRSP